jgi:hypothetical protein
MTAEGRTVRAVQSRRPCMTGFAVGATPAGGTSAESRRKNAVQIPLDRDENVKPSTNKGGTEIAEFLLSPP